MTILFKNKYKQYTLIFVEINILNMKIRCDNNKNNYKNKYLYVMNWHQIEGVHLNELIPGVILNLIFKHL